MEKTQKAMVWYLIKTKTNNDIFFCFRFQIPTVILAEFNTHRAFSRNAASTRAISLKKYRKRVLENPFVPDEFVENSGAMFSDKKIGGWKDVLARWCWYAGLYTSAGLHFVLEKLNVHKQHANRILSPYAYTDVIASIADPYSLDNFFRLRCASDAQPEFRKIALLIRYIYDNSPAFEANPGDIVDPLQGVISPEELNSKLLVTSVARIARVSYASDESDLDKNLKLTKRLYKNGHRSPFEHIVVAVGNSVRYHNRIGYINLRQIIFPDEFFTIRELIPAEIRDIVYHLKDTLTQTLR